MKAFFIIFLLLGATICIVTCDDNKEDRAREHFRPNPNCRVVENPKNEVLYKVKFPMHLPNIGLLVVTEQMHLSNLNGNLKTFHYDKESQKLIMTIDYTSGGVHCFAPDTSYVFSQIGREPKLKKDYFNATYFTNITAEIDASNGITAESFKNAFYYAYFPHSESPIYIGDEVTGSEDPVIQESVNGLVADKKMALRLIMGTKACFIFMAFFQSRICDFDLNPAMNEYDSPVLDSVRNIDVDDESNFVTLGDGNDLFKDASKYFKENSQCSGIGQPQAEPYFRRPSVLPLPYINSTAFYPNSQVSGLKDGRVETFYYNQKSKNLVLSVAFNEIATEDRQCHLYIHQLSAPSTLIREYTRDYFRDIRITLVLPIGDGLTAQSFEKGFVSYVIKKQLTAKVGPEFGQSGDPQMQEIMYLVANDPDKISYNLALTEGREFITTFVQKHICDFGAPQKTL